MVSNKTQNIKDLAQEKKLERLVITRNKKIFMEIDKEYKIKRY